MQITELVKNFCSAQNSSENFSNKFFYKINQRFKLLEDEEFDFDNAVQIMAMEYCRSIDNKDVNIQEAKEIVEPLLKQCKDPKTGNIKPDAALLVRFLAQKGLER